MADAGYPGTPPAGWYPDPAGSAPLRWWDGRAWTDSVGTPDASGLLPPPPTPSNTTRTVLLVILGVIGTLVALLVLLVGACLVAITGGGPL